MFSFLYPLVSCLAVLQLTAGLPSIRKRDADFESVRTHLDRSHSNIDDDHPDKYFHESTFHQHYDGRFAANQLPYDERVAHLTALIQTYLSTMNDVGAETWIMHGSLLGWYWNRKIMPWDSDVDVMLSERSMYFLAVSYNMTIHHYKLPGITEGRDYMLEISPHWNNGSVSDGANVIDARWIDTDTGMFIDITTLRRNFTAETEGKEGAMMVKDRHKYLYDDIFPLRETTFEGAPAKVPFAYAELLTEEYGEHALSDIYWENHRFDSEKQEWIPLSCKDFGTCGHYRNKLDLPNDMAELAETEDGSLQVHEFEHPHYSLKDFTAPNQKPDTRLRFGSRRPPLHDHITGHDGRDWL